MTDAKSVGRDQLVDVDDRVSGNAIGSRNGIHRIAGLYCINDHDRLTGGVVINSICGNEMIVRKMAIELKCLAR